MFNEFCPASSSGTDEKADWHAGKANERVLHAFGSVRDLDV